jgi:tetratricopeptide (TPR) repeat protein
MGLFKKLFTTDPGALERKADALFAEGDFGPAKLAYDKALGAHVDRDHPPLVDKIRQCIDAIARQRIDQAKSYLADGALELAAHELEGALEVAASDALREEAQRLLDGFEAEDAREQAVSHEMTDEERIALIAGQWQDAQADEYEGYGQPLFDALVAMQSERFEEAREGLETITDAAQEPRYLWLELGRARLLTEDLAGGKEALERFLGALDAQEGGETRLAAYLALARLADEGGDFEEAMSHFEGAVHALPEDYRPYLAMGAFLRDKGHRDEALDVLRTSLELSKTASVDWRLLEELGLAHEAAEKTEEAKSFLEQVIDFFTQHQVTDFPIPTATTLAKLYESDGKLDRAADMYRALSQGGDHENHALYHYEAARLLRELGLDDEAHRMLTRAEALAANEELRGKIAALMQHE